MDLSQSSGHDSPERKAALSESPLCVLDRTEDLGLVRARESEVACTPHDFQRLGQYRVDRKLGSGGMGAVYLGIEDGSGTEVAIKVMNRDAMHDTEAVRRFEKEARLLAEVKHPHVTNLLDFGTQAGVTYLVLEFVNGIDLKSLLSQRKILAERACLRMIRDVADALAEAHERGIVHRDIKPGNIMLAGAVPSQRSTAAILLSEIDAGDIPIVKLTDFGLARQIEQSESLALTRTGAMLGTPYYLAPEQCADQAEICPATDVYSLGVTLFEMLAGRPPFHASDPVKLIALHCFETPPDLRKLNPEVSDGVAALIERCLQKTPHGRFADGAHLRDALDALLGGDVHSPLTHPLLPAASRAISSVRWEWDLHSPPDLIWPYVSNTERINQAVGLPSVAYETVRGEEGTLHKIGSFQLGFARLRWEEHPFEWIEGQRLGVLREFQSGPFEWFVSIVELQPLPTGGSRLTHLVQIAPRVLIGQWLAHFELNIKGKKNVDRVYTRIDKIVSSTVRQQREQDPFAPPEKLKSAVRTRLKSQQELLVQECAHPESVAALIEFLSERPAQELARIRPFAVADQLGQPRAEFTEVCLQACRQGLLELHWDILCPTCRVSTNIADTLQQIEKHTYCESCDLDFEVDFQNAIELIFRIHPDIRQADLKTYCIGGPEHAPHVVAQARLVAGERMEWDLFLDAGTYILRSPQLPYTLRLEVAADSGSTRCRVPLRPQPGTANRKLRAGRQLIAIENELQKPLLLRLERAVLKQDVLTASQASQLKLFRELFPSEVLNRRQLSELSTCTILGARVLNLEQLYEQATDTEVHEGLETALKTLAELIELRSGQVIKIQEDRLLAAFPLAAAAVEASADLFATPQNIARTPLSLGLALHRGSALTTTNSGKLDYVGRTVTQTGLMLNRIERAGLTLSPEVAEDVSLHSLLDEYRFQATHPSQTHFQLIQTIPSTQASAPEDA